MTPPPLLMFLATSLMYNKLGHKLKEMYKCINNEILSTHFYGSIPIDWTKNYLDFYSSIIFFFWLNDLVVYTILNGTPFIIILSFSVINMFYKLLYRCNDFKLKM